MAGPRGLSSLVNDALPVRLQQVWVARLLDEMDDEFGPVPPATAEEVARQWLGTTRLKSTGTAPTGHHAGVAASASAEASRSRQ